MDFCVFCLFWGRFLSRVKVNFFYVFGRFMGELGPGTTPQIAGVLLKASGVLLKAPGVL